MKTNNPLKESGCCQCTAKACLKGSEGLPEGCVTGLLQSSDIQKNTMTYYQNPSLLKKMHTAAEIEGQFYGKLTRVEETIEFIKRMEYQKVGIASCAGLSKETRAFSKLLSHHKISHFGALCKVGAADKSLVGIPTENRVHPESSFEAMCNPVLQASILSEQQTDFNVLIGLCVGHDALFSVHSKSPMTTLVVKDRVTCHQSAAPLYQLDGYYSRLMK
ncbi:Uncharacterized metal-binding protein [Tindallia magadiensis]|uniref:Uncharacterized metal-binding protein n=1 Tax=Tindallia magadiensis TaxID=69895 RepID=A0A1I3EM42_9FIRM|nr:DUF1847 domain-containing protein [Tindallia magadiensis]SFI00032.1 Uncharacterized metal-binding protein [Tindallia magadiensis]